MLRSEKEYQSCIRARVRYQEVLEESKNLPDDDPTKQQHIQAYREEIRKLTELIEEYENKPI